MAVFMPGKQANSTNQIGSLSHPFLPESWLLNTSQHSIELLNYFLVAFKHSLRTRAENSSAASLLGEILLVKKRVTSQSSEFLVV